MDNIGARFAPYIRKAWKEFWMHSSIQLGNAVRVESLFIRLETMYVLGQDGCTVCTLRTNGLEVVLDALDDTPR